MTKEAWEAFVIRLGDQVSPGDAALDILSSVLSEAGAAGLEVRDTTRPIEVIAYFSTALGIEPVGLQGVLDDARICVKSMVRQTVPEVDWAEQWKEHFRPLAFEPLWVVPSWLEPPPRADRVIRIDPSRAFGTGHHATTALILEEIARAPPREFLDVGTGTGILALSALRLGARRAVAIDTDPEALVVAAENAALNRLADRLELSDRSLADVLGSFDAVAANILAVPLIAMADDLVSNLAVGGRLLLSGILEPQAEEVRAAFEARGLRHRATRRRGDWVCIDLERPAVG